MLMQMMTTSAPGGMRMPMMAMVARVVHSDNLAVGWLYHLFNSMVIGALFGWLLGNRVRGARSGAVWGILYGLVWWVLGGIILMPVLLGMPAFAPLQMPEMRPVAMGSLMGHGLYGVVLGLGYTWLRERGRSDAGMGGPAGTSPPAGRR